jgi:hypothetical protein
MAAAWPKGQGRASRRPATGRSGLITIKGSFSRDPRPNLSRSQAPNRGLAPPPDADSHDRGPATPEAWRGCPIDPSLSASDRKWVLSDGTLYPPARVREQIRTGARKLPQ